MSLESIFRVVSNALKSANEANGGSAEEKAALDVLGGLSAMLEARVQLHKHATPATLTAEALAAGKAAPLVGAPRQAKSAAAPAPAEFSGNNVRRAPPGMRYDLK